MRSKNDRKVYISDEIENCRDLGGIAYRSPFERVSCDSHVVKLTTGYVDVLGRGEDGLGPRLFSSGYECELECPVYANSQINPPETSLLVTEPYFNLPNIAETYDQMVFEEWEFASYYRCTRE